MNDMQIFEQQLASGLGQLAGPPRYVDAMAISRTVIAQPHKRSFRSMFTANKYVVASVIAMLFGGFLLAGLLVAPRGDDMAPAAVTDAPSPTTTEELLSGMATEEVGRGVYQVLDAGAWHDLVAEPPAGLPIAPDGSVIVDGERNVMLPTPEDPSLAGFFQGARRSFSGGYFAAVDDAAWLANGDHQSSTTRIPPPAGLLHFDGTGWEVVDLPTDGLSGEIRVPDSYAWIADGWIAGPLALGRDRTLWLYLEKGGRRKTEKINDRQAGYLARLDSDGWQLFTALDDGVPKLVFYGGDEAGMAVDGSGTLWIAPPYYRGVVAFDGGSWRQYLDGLDVKHVAVAPDGSVFATARSGCVDLAVTFERSVPTLDDLTAHSCTSEPDPSMAGLYVITPEAAAATE